MDGKRRIAHADTRRSAECEIRNSPLPAEKVSHYGEEEAERLLRDVYHTDVGTVHRTGVKKFWVEIR